MAGYGMMVLLFGGGLFAFIIPTMFFISWQLTLISFIPMIFLVVSTYFLSRKQEEYVEQNREAVAQLNDEVLESIEGIRVMRAYSRRDQQVKQFQKKTASLSKTGDKIASIQYSFGPLALLFIGFSTVLLLLFGGQSLASGQLSLGKLLALQLYLIEPMWMMADLILVYQTGQMSYKKLKEVIDETDDLEPDGPHYLEQIDLVQFKDYSFSYPGAERKSLSGIDWTIQKEHILFSKSIRENIALGKKGASQEDLVEAVAQAAFADDLERMSQGMDTLIGEKGVSVSGGQKQRISLARAFLRDAELLLLDDSLSAVDAKTEQAIIDTIQKERKDKTTIIVSHRLSAVHQADWIIVLDQGRIVEEGRASDLLAQEGWYYEQYQRQQKQEGE